MSKEDTISSIVPLGATRTLPVVAAADPADPATREFVEQILKAAIEAPGTLVKAEKLNAVRLCASGALGKVGAAVASSSPQCIDIAKKALVALDSATVDFAAGVVKQMDSPEAEIRLAAIETAGKLGKAAATHTGEVARHLRDRDGLSRAAACVALGKMGDKACAYDEQVARCVEDKLFEVRQAACSTLGICQQILFILFALLVLFQLLLRLCELTPWHKINLITQAKSASATYSASPGRRGMRLQSRVG